MTVEIDLTKPIDLQVELIKRKVLEELLPQLRPSQLDLFYRLYPNGVVLTDKLSWAITQCQNTIAKNLGWI
jgi:hypothetical protein